MRRIRSAAIPLVVFLVAAWLPDGLTGFGPYEALREVSTAAALLLRAALQIGICAAALAWARRLPPTEVPAELGLRPNPVRGIVFGVVATLPMLLTLGAVGRLALPLDGRALWAGALLFPFVEEVLFRGYLFGQLYRHARWSFWPAALIVAALFGVGHIWQALVNDRGMGGVFGVVLVTAIGSVFFSWLLLRWEFDLWVPVAVHALMNLWWELFAVDATAIGTTSANVSRLAVIALAVGLTVWKAPSVAPVVPETAREAGA